MVLDDIETMYSKVMEYLTTKVEYFKDPSYVQTEMSDFNSEFNLADLVYNIQLQIQHNPSLSESKLIKAYRDLRALEAEYNIRLMTRVDYNADALVEESDNVEKWNSNKKLIKLHMIGKDAGA